MKYTRTGPALIPFCNTTTTFWIDDCPHKPTCLFNMFCSDSCFLKNILGGHPSQNNFKSNVKYYHFTEKIMHLGIDCTDQFY